ncbi:hypothetical protein R3Q06_11385 [Rhodococcus erythropolis]|uniref:hypothetical protein n=1 Tax=Rhodococcus erythropolis TaxID=1833 RepID=UPI002949D650|nr:hypothetical protein [Rhodococcus erythropolis]MDV6274103.1 hypothetical protein [Rhodococcus erythropolis]
MSKIISAFPQIRLAIYGIASATLAGLVIAGVVTEGQSSNILNYVGLGLGALATLLAGLNVPKATPVVNPVETVIVGGHSMPAINDVITQGIKQAQAAIAPSVDEIRAQLERQLGHRPGG